MRDLENHMPNLKIWYEPMENDAIWNKHLKDKMDFLNRVRTGEPLPQVYYYV